ncbi:MAG: hypothetical protein A3D15_03550 [Alphaproteobacteria bacterium RIFCSPHIGHO2_02_FULL_40_34]|nr:MAG: hypothetical protein A3D15_03550 [Alphaproteobacteria bacterium RIFCSPHIGHO2_02_FULL_40_34]OFX12323.1 MAG: hypothetical protein A3G22_03500 [Alphaproteobacteria bacterium RIFCSPLOWO2_12_FULL_40_11]
MVNNRDVVNITFHPLPFAIETRMFLIMIAFFLCGLIFGIIVCSKSIIGYVIEKFRSGKKIKNLEKQMSKT